MTSEDIRDIMATFMEGVIEELSPDKKDINFKIECRYLASLINPVYENFYGTFKNVEDIYFIPWDDDSYVIEALTEIEKFRPDILNIELEENGYLKIYGNCSKEYTGGNLFIKAREVKIYDEEFELMSYEDLMDLSEKFWYSGNKA